MPEGKFVFLGYEFCQLHSWKLKKKYLGVRPSQKAIQSLMGKVHEKTAANRGCLPASVVAAEINRMVVGWANYFKVGAITKAYKIMRRYIVCRFRQWLGRKHKWKTKKYKEYTDNALYEMYGLIELMSKTPSYS
jgi:hypothetical protein